MAKKGLKRNGRLKKGYRFAKCGCVVKAKRTTQKLELLTILPAQFLVA